MSCCFSVSKKTAEKKMGAARCRLLLWLRYKPWCPVWVPFIWKNFNKIQLLASSYHTIDETLPNNNENNNDDDDCCLQPFVLLLLQDTGCCFDGGGGGGGGGGGDCKKVKFLVVDDDCQLSSLKDEMDRVWEFLLFETTFRLLLLVVSFFKGNFGLFEEAIFFLFEIEIEIDKFKMCNKLLLRFVANFWQW